MGFQSNINNTLATAAVGASLINKQKNDKESLEDKKASELASVQNSLHIANEKMANDQEAVDKHSNYESFKNKKGREQFRDKTTGKLIKRFDYEQHQKALATAQEQLLLSTAIRDSFKERLAKLTGGNLNG